MPQRQLEEAWVLRLCIVHRGTCSMNLHMMMCAFLERSVSYAASHHGLPMPAAGFHLMEELIAVHIPRIHHVAARKVA